MNAKYTAEDVFQLAVHLAADEFQAKGAGTVAEYNEARRATNAAIRKYAAMTGFDVDAVARFVESELIPS